MNKFKHGSIAFLCYLLVALIAYWIAGWSGNIGSRAVFLFAFLATVIIWYEALNKAFLAGLSQGLFVQLFFIIPSLIIAYLAYPVAETPGVGGKVSETIYTIFHAPFLNNLGPLMDFTARPLLAVFFPSFVILLISIYPVTKYIIAALRNQNTQYIIR